MVYTPSCSSLCTAFFRRSPCTTSSFAPPSIIRYHNRLYGFFGTKTIKTPKLLSVAYGPWSDLMTLCLKASFRTSPKLIPVAFCNTAIIIGKNIVSLRFTEKGADFNCHLLKKITAPFSARSAGFRATMMAEFWDKTGLCLWPARKFTFRRKGKRMGRWAVGLSHHAWCF